MLSLFKSTVDSGCRIVFYPTHFYGEKIEWRALIAVVAVNTGTLLADTVHTRQEARLDRFAMAS